MTGLKFTFNARFVDLFCLAIDYLCNIRVKTKYAGMSQSDLAKLRSLEEENRRLKKMYADLSMDHDILKDVVEKKLQVRLEEES